MNNLTKIEEEIKREYERKLKIKREDEILSIRNKINFFINGLDNNMERLGQIMDPTIRSTIFLHTLLTSFDFLTPFVFMILSDGKKDVMTPDIKKKSQVTMDRVKHELNNIMLLCQSAMYAPEHPIKIKIVDKIKLEYEKNKKSFDSNEVSNELSSPSNKVTPK